MTRESSGESLVVQHSTGLLYWTSPWPELLGYGAPADTQFVFWETSEQAAAYFDHSPEGQQLASQIGIDEGRGEAVDPSLPAGFAWPLGGTTDFFSPLAQPRAPMLFMFETRANVRLGGESAIYWHASRSAAFQGTDPSIAPFPWMTIRLAGISASSDDLGAAIGAEFEAQGPGGADERPVFDDAIADLQVVRDYLTDELRNGDLTVVERAVVRELALPALNTLIIRFADLQPAWDLHLAQSKADLESSGRVLEDSVQHPGLSRWLKRAATVAYEMWRAAGFPFP